MLLKLSIHCRFLTHEQNLQIRPLRNRIDGSGYDLSRGVVASHGIYRYSDHLKALPFLSSSIHTISHIKIEINLFLHEKESGTAI